MLSAFDIAYESCCEQDMVPLTDEDLPGEGFFSSVRDKAINKVGGKMRDKIRNKMQDSSKEKDLPPALQSMNYRFKNYDLGRAR